MLSVPQKKELSNAIAKLDIKDLEKVIKVIHEGVPEVRDAQGQVAVEIDQLPPVVLMQLYTLFVGPLDINPGPARKNNDYHDLTSEQVKDLAEKISRLHRIDLEKVIQIIHDNVPEIRDAKGEIELEINLLPSAVLIKLYDHLFEPTTGSAESKGVSRSSKTALAQLASVNNDSLTASMKKMLVDAIEGAKLEKITQMIFNDGDIHKNTAKAKAIKQEADQLSKAALARLFSVVLQYITQDIPTDGSKSSQTQKLGLDSDTPLSKAIRRLKEDKLDEVLQIIHEFTFNDIASKAEEIGLKMDLLPDGALTKLYNLVFEASPPKQELQEEGNITSNLKRKRADDDDDKDRVKQLEERVKQLKQRLARFERGVST